MNKRLYTAFSIFSFLWSLGLRIVCVVGIIYLYTVYDENPMVISVIIGVCCLLIFFLGDDQITVYEDKITQTTNSFYGLLFRPEKRFVKIESIELAYLEKIPDSTTEEIAAALLIRAMMPKLDTMNKDRRSPIFFKLKNGETKVFQTDLDDDQRMTIVSLVNKLVK